MIEFIMGLLLLIVITILLMDVVPIFMTWLSRIHIGRYDNKNTWSEKVLNIGIKWLNKTPKIKVTDNTRLIVIDMLKGNYTKSAIQHWQEASLLLGLLEYLKYNDDKFVEKEIRKFIDTKLDENGQWVKKPQNIDGAILAYAIMKIDFLNINKYKPAFDYIFNLITEHIGEDKTVRYRLSMNEYRYVDTIGFICPFLICYGQKYNNRSSIELAINQIKKYEKYGMLSEHNIPCHAYKIKNKLPLGLYGWGRGLAWYAIGIIDSWNELDENSEYKKILEESVIKFAKASKRFQNENGSWNWSVTREETRADSSTTSVLAWFMINASKIESISYESRECGNNAINYLMSITRRSGIVDFSQGDTKDIGVYSLLFDKLPFTQGFSIRCINLLNNINSLKMNN